MGQLPFWQCFSQTDLLTKNIFRKKKILIWSGNTHQKTLKQLCILPWLWEKNLDCLTYYLCCMHNSWSLLAEIFHINLALHKIHSNRSKGQASFIISWSDICNPSYSSCLKGEKRYSLGEWGVAHNPRSIRGRENKVPLCQRGNVLKFGDVILP